MRILYAFKTQNVLTQRDQEVLKANFELIPNQFYYRGNLELFKAFLRDLLNIKAWRKRNFDIVVVRFAGYHGVFPLIFSKFFKIPAVIIIGGTDAAKLPSINYGFYRNWRLSVINNLNLQLAKNVICVHESLVYQDYDYDDDVPKKQGLKAFYSGKLNTHVCYNGYDSEVFKPNQKKIREKNTFLTVAGNLSTDIEVKRKGVDLILKVASDNPELTFSIVGDKNIPAHFEITENVKILGFKSSEELVDIFSEHQFYMQISMFEGFPNALSEAMLCGCVPIGSNVSGIPFIIDNTGFILQKRKTDELHSLIQKAINSTNLEALSIAARQRIKENFTMEKRKDCYKKTLKQIASKK